jgi:hypothetical protein
MVALDLVGHAPEDQALQYVLGNQERVQVLVSVQDLSQVADHFLLEMVARVPVVVRAVTAPAQVALDQAVDMAARGVGHAHQVALQVVALPVVAAADPVKRAAPLVAAARAARALGHRNREKLDARRSTTYAHRL